MDNEVRVSYNYAPIGVAVSSLSAGTKMVSFGPNDTWNTVIERVREEELKAGHALVQRGPLGDVWATELHQPEHSRGFAKLSAQSADWSKLPDWPEWSRQMASVPL